MSLFEANRERYCMSALLNDEGVVQSRSHGMSTRYKTLEDMVAPDDHDTVRALMRRGGGHCGVRANIEGWPGHAELSMEQMLDRGGAPLWLVRLTGRAEQRLALEEMVSVVAHEVKNPLAGISGALEVVGARAAAGSSEARMMKAARQRVRSLDETLEDLLLLTRPLTVERVPQDLGRALDSAATKAAASLGQAPMMVAHRESPGVMEFDPTLLGRAFTYLIDHALREDPQGAQVSLDSCLGGWTLALNYANGQLERDIGDRIFDARYLTRSRRTGLHLPVAARLVRAHGGEVSVAVPDDRVTLTVYLPDATYCAPESVSMSSSMR